MRPAWYLNLNKEAYLLKDKNLYQLFTKKSNWITVIVLISLSTIPSFLN